MTTFKHEPAFPLPVDAPNNGLTKREYFATQALIGLLAGSWSALYIDNARGAIKLADQLIAELNKTDKRVE